MGTQRGFEEESLPTEEPVQKELVPAILESVTTGAVFLNPAYACIYHVSGKSLILYVHSFGVVARSCPCGIFLLNMTDRAKRCDVVVEQNVVTGQLGGRVT